MQDVRMSVRENRLESMVIGDAQVIEVIEQTGRGWVIDDDGKIVGFGIANRETSNIWSLFFHPNHERKGYGRKILDEESIAANGRSRCCDGGGIVLRCASSGLA